MQVSELPSIGECQQLVGEPGPFFQEPRCVPYFWAILMEREANDNFNQVITVTEEHKRMFKELTVGQRIVLREAEDGSITLV